MILELRVAISEWLGCGCTKADGDYILQKIEDLGMQPPNVRLNELHPNSTLKETNPTNWYAVWEPEDV